MTDTAPMDIKKIWQIIIRRQYLFIAVSLAVLSVIVWGSFFIPEKYEAKSTVFIEQSAIKKLIQGTGRRSREEDSLRGLKYTMLSRKVLLKVINEMDLDVMARNDAEIESMTEKLAQNTNITASTKEDIFTVSYKGKDPAIVQEYVNTLVEKYIETISSLKKEDAFGASRFLSGQIDYYKDKIAAIEGELADFRREEGIYLAIDESALVRSMTGYKEEIEDVEMEIRNLKAKKKRIKQQLSGESPFTLALIDINRGDSLTARLKALEQKLQLLLMKYTENYPEVIKIKIEIETLKKLMDAEEANGGDGANPYSNLSAGMSMANPIYQQLRENLLNLESEIDSLKAKKETLGNRIKRSENELKNIPENKKILTNLERDRGTYQTLYEQMLAKLGQAEVNEQVEAQNKGEVYKIIERAVLPRRPVSPNRVMLILLGIFGGIAAGIGAVLLMDKNESSIRDIDTLKSLLGIKVLAVIPAIVTENDIRRKRKIDRRVYAFSIFYLLIIGSVFINELINRFF
ncbi:MAG TPA: hypothetical protein ENH01_02030 [Nitrospirae bacterium]|nr:hypothetical protein [Nitrospirota bacterium]